MVILKLKKTVYSTRTKLMKNVIYYKDFSIAHELTEINEEPTRVHETTAHQAKTLDLFLTSCLEKFFAEVLSPLCVHVVAKPKVSLM